MIRSATNRWIAALALAPTLVLQGCGQQDVEVLSQTEPAAASQLAQTEHRPNLAAPMSGPALPDFGQIGDVKTKKLAFFNYLQPLIEQENQHLLRLRDQFDALEKLLDAQGQLHPDDARWISRTARLYRADADDPADQLRILKAKVDQIPAALVKAQAANESAWGTSRFAREANNLFGQWCFSHGCGIAPLQRDPDDRHEVEAFASVTAGLRSYFTNLNGNRSYASLRQIRRCLDAQQQPPSGRALAAGLTNYSARGGHYVEELQAMIRINRLERWQQDWWGDSDQQHPCYALVQTEADHPDPVIVAAMPEVDANAEWEPKLKQDAATDAAPATAPEAAAADLRPTIGTSGAVVSNTAILIPVISTTQAATLITASTPASVSQASAITAAVTTASSAPASPGSVFDSDAGLTKTAPPKNAINDSNHAPANAPNSAVGAFSPATDDS